LQYDHERAGDLFLVFAKKIIHIKTVESETLATDFEAQLQQHAKMIPHLTVDLWPCNLSTKLESLLLVYDGDRTLHLLY
jgi:hypothetical protein